ncbi:MAG: 2-C-methyl-D-erythritol 2,4-cyclodiphosphate synthase [Cyanobacteria bacterium P01_H01_bin.74]
MAFRIGQGYDLHALCANKPLTLGGIIIPESSKGTIAHSDGDVLLHALIDALLGACALNDIGYHFPPSDDKYKNIDSTVLLEKVMKLIAQENYILVNIDSTVFLEKPKLSPHVFNIRARLSTLLCHPIESISVKAKTAERFAPIGTQEAIAASATVLLQNK